MRPSTNEHGHVDISSVCDLPPSDLEDWILSRLLGKDTSVPEPTRMQVGQYALIGRIFPRLDLETQQDVCHILLRCLLEMQAEEGPWTGDAAHALLLTASNVGDESFVDPVYAMARQGRFRGETDEDNGVSLHSRLLQTLVNLPGSRPRNFWEEELERDPEQHAGYAFAGIRKWSLQDALGIVLNTAGLDNPNNADWLFAEIRALLSDTSYTHRELKKEITSIQDFLPPAANELIAEALPELFEDVGPYQRHAKVLAESGKRKQLERAILYP